MLYKSIQMCWSLALSKKPKNHRERIYEDYLVRIQSGEITPDDRLVDVTIAEAEGVSRMPVRDALMRLVHEGYLATSTRGFVIPEWDRKDVLEVFEVRRMLDPRAAALAAHHLDALRLREMDAAVSDAILTLETKDTPKFYRASEIFRNAWLSAVPNGYLRQAISRYQSQVQAVRLVTMTDAESHETIVSVQQELLNAFAAHDSVRASDLMLKFVIAAETNYAKLTRVPSK